MKSGIVLFFFLGWTCLSHAQTITITDRQTHRPLEGVTVISDAPKVTVVTNLRGQAEISAFKEASEIRIRILGYKTEVYSYQHIQALSFRIELEHARMDLDQVVVSSERWQQSNNKVPSEIISISPEEVLIHNPQTSADLLGLSGRIFIQKSQQGGGSPMIRGFAANRLLYTVDGVRMNTAIFRSGNLQNVISLDPFAGENTEVLFGPGSVAYGSDAIGGVMSFQTLTPQLSVSEKPFVTGKAVTRYSSSNNERTGHFDVNIGWEKWALVSSFSTWNFDHLRQGSNGPDDYIKNIHVQRQDSTDVVITQEDPLLQIPSAYSQFNFMQKVRFSPDEKLDFQYGFHYSATSPYGRYDRHNRYRNGTPRYGEWNYGPQLWIMNNLYVSHKGHNAAYDRLNIHLALQSFEESRIDRSLNDNERNTQTENVEAYSVNLDAVKSTGARNKLFYGAEFVLNDVKSEGLLTDISTGAEEGGPSRYPQSVWTSIALYVNDEFRASEKFTLQAGLRYNQYMLDADFSNNTLYYPFPFTTAVINDGAFSGSIGGVYRPDENWAFRADFGTGFRSPNADDLGKVFDSEPGAVTVPNPDLEAEYACNFDLGLARIFDDAVKIDITAYYTILLNAMVRRDFQLNGEDSIMYDGILSRVQAVQNAADASVYGVQAGMELNLPAGFMIRTDWNFQTGEEELDDGSNSPLRHAAPLFGSGRLRYRTNDLIIELNAMYQAEKSFNELPLEEQEKDEIYAKDSNGNNYSPAWYTLNLKTTYRLNDTFRISAGVENLTDQRYRPYSSGISGPGRNFVLSLTAGF